MDAAKQEFVPLEVSSTMPEPIVACQDNIQFMRSLPAESIKLIVTSPPYNIGKKYERRSPMQEYLRQQCDVVQEAVRVLHPQGSICWQVGNYVKDGEVTPLDVVLFPLFRNFGLKLRNRIIWHFEHGLHCSRRFSGRYETILWFTKGDDYTFNLDEVRVPSKYPGKKHFKGPKRGELSGHPNGKNPTDSWSTPPADFEGDFWTIPNVKFNHVEKTLHPCQFPVELIERLVVALTNAGDNVLDPYMGVGSAVLAAMKRDRRGFGCDIVEDYVEVARERITLLQKGQLRLRPMGKPVYDPNKKNGGHR